MTRTALRKAEDLALFLDVDGTLLEIAATPGRVRVPASLRNTLRLAFERQARRTMQGLDGWVELRVPGQVLISTRLPQGTAGDLRAPATLSPAAMVQPLMPVPGAPQVFLGSSTKHRSCGPGVV